MRTRTPWWLLLLALPWSASLAAIGPWTEGAGFRSAPVEPGAGRGPGFTLVDPGTTTVTFTNVLTGDAYVTNAVAHNGSGVAVGDVDGDGRPDLYFCCLDGPNRLYRNLGEWRFELKDAGEAACEGQDSTGAAFADVDGNGSLDLLVNGIGAGTRLFLNDGRGGFKERTGAGLATEASATSLALGDIDDDGDLDLYCTHYIDVMHLADPTTKFALARRESGWVVTKVNGQSTTLPRWKDRFQALPDGSVRELPEFDGFYRNDGTGRFTSILFEPGMFNDETGKPLPPARDWGLSVMFRDINQDGAPDLYVCNDNASPDRAWLNTGRGTFEALPTDRFRHTSRSSMGLDFADVNRDERDDLFVLDMLAREHSKRMTQLVRDRPKASEIEQLDSQPRFNRNMLFLAQADGSFAEVALMSGVAATGWSWCPMFLDVDLDGYEDLVVTTGFGMDVMDQDSDDLMRQSLRRMTDDQRRRVRSLHPAWPTRNLAFRNRGDGAFEAMSQWGFDQVGISNGAALGDLDNDGDLDLVINNLNAVSSLYRNDSPGARIGVRLLGRPPNTHGIGARLRLVTRSLVQSQEVIAGGRYMSGDQPMRVFAATAPAGEPMRLEVRWPRGARSTLPAVEGNRIYEVREPDDIAPPVSAPPPPPRPFFSDVSAMLGHRHVESSFDDWARQPLLPRRLSRLGPGLCWSDVNGDGWEDLLVAASAGGRLALCLNQAGRGFRQIESPAETAGDQTTVLVWPDGRGQQHVLVGTSNDELPPPAESTIGGFSATDLAPTRSWPAGRASVGPLAMADVDGDGDLDLFVGARCLPGRYPEPAESTLWLNDQGHLTSGGTVNDRFLAAGLVSGATFADVDADGDADLVLAPEWGPIRLFINRGGSFEEATAAWGLDQVTGWWTSVTAGDFDGDGQVDLAAGNWGHNTIYALCQPTTFRLYYGDWNGDGFVELIEAWMLQDRWLPVRDRAWLARGMPDLTSRFATHQAFADAAVPDLLPPGTDRPAYLEAASLTSTVFLNRRDWFEPRPLPAEAQRAPVFGINVGDFDGDGLEDLFLGQNFFGTASDLSRDDGGSGLWLRGQGDGRFKAVDSSASGITILGEQRGTALADFNHDGRVDLAVSQNGSATRLYLNQGARPGLRVSIHGPPGNPKGVGTQMRLVYPGDRHGPSRIVQAGSGYWSQDAPEQVLGKHEEPEGLWVRWPGGREQVVPLEPGDTARQIDF